MDRMNVPRPKKPVLVPSDWDGIEGAPAQPPREQKQHQNQEQVCGTLDEVDYHQVVGTLRDQAIEPAVIPFRRGQAVEPDR